MAGDALRLRSMRTSVRPPNVRATPSAKIEPLALPVEGRVPFVATVTASTVLLGARELVEAMVETGAAAVVVVAFSIVVGVEDVVVDSAVVVVVAFSIVVGVEDVVGDSAVVVVTSAVVVVAFSAVVVVAFSVVVVVAWSAHGYVTVALIVPIGKPVPSCGKS